MRPARLALGAVRSADPLRGGERRLSAARYFFFRFQLSLAGVPTLPAWSVARTSNVCLPFLTFTVCGEVQLENGPPSRPHWKLATALASVPVNSNVAVFCRVFSWGPAVIATVGGVESFAGGVTSPEGGGEVGGPLVAGISCGGCTPNRPSKGLSNEWIRAPSTAIRYVVPAAASKESTCSLHGKLIPIPMLCATSVKDSTDPRCDRKLPPQQGIRVMELAGLEPATSWVRCGLASRGQSRIFRL